MKRKRGFMMIYLLSLFFLFSCASKINTSEELLIEWVNGDPIKNLDGSIKKLKFDNPTQAKSYAMERRLLLLRKFEVIAEPYFGTANAKRCTDNIKSDILEISPTSLMLVLQILTKGEERVIHDCLEENNTHWAHIELLVCQNQLYDIRLYYPLGNKPSYKSLFKCKN